LGPFSSRPDQNDNPPEINFSSPQPEETKEARKLNKAGVSIMLRGTLLIGSVVALASVIHDPTAAINMFNFCRQSFHCVAYPTENVEMAKLAFSMIPGFKEVIISGAANAIAMGAYSVVRLRQPHK
jgi:hypothetical protein